LKLKHMVVLGGWCLLSAAASAQVYGGIGAGLAHSNATNGLDETYVHDYTDHKDQNDIGAIVYLGYAFNQYIAIEGDFLDLGSFTWNAYNIGYDISAKVEAQGYSIGVVGTLPLSENFGLDGKIGVGAIRQKFRCLASCDIPDTSKTSTVLVGAVGAHWNAMKHLRIRTAYEHLGGGSFTAYMSSGDKVTKSADFGLLYAGADLSF